MERSSPKPFENGVNGSTPSPCRHGVVRQVAAIAPRLKGSRPPTALLRLRTRLGLLKHCGGVAGTRERGRQRQKRADGATRSREAGAVGEPSRPVMASPPAAGSLVTAGIVASVRSGSPRLLPANMRTGPCQAD